MSWKPQLKQQIMSSSNRLASPCSWQHGVGVERNAGGIDECHMGVFASFVGLVRLYSVVGHAQSFPEVRPDLRTVPTQKA